jgi:hypothetical protein
MAWDTPSLGRKRLERDREASDLLTHYSLSRPIQEA